MRPLSERDRPGRLRRRAAEPAPEAAPAVDRQAPPPDTDRDTDRASAALPTVPDDVLRACRRALAELGDVAMSGLAITSTERQEGRSTVALGAALMLRQRSERKVVLVELDFERPSLAATMGLVPTDGLAGVLRGERRVVECLSWVTPTFAVLQAGSGGVDDDASRTGAALREVLAELQELGYLVVADLPPLPPHGRGDTMVDLFSATILVVRAGRTRLPAVRSAVRLLAVPPAVVLNGKSSAVPRWVRALGV